MRMPGTNLVIAFFFVLIGAATNCAQAHPDAVARDGSCDVHKHGYHHRFQDAEAWAKKFDDPARDKWQKPDEVIKALHIQPNDKIADIGAGTGYFSFRLAAAFPHAKVYATDVEDDMVEYLKKQTTKKGLLNHQPIKVESLAPDLPEKVNLVLIVDTYHHIDDRVPYFEALRKQLLPNARVAIIDFTAKSPEGPPPEHRISPQEVQDEMQKAGYKLDRKLALLPYQYFLIFKPTGSGPNEPAQP